MPNPAVAMDPTKIMNNLLQRMLLVTNVPAMVAMAAARMEEMGEEARMVLLVVTVKKTARVLEKSRVQVVESCHPLLRSRTLMTTKTGTDHREGHKAKMTNQNKKTNKNMKMVVQDREMVVGTATAVMVAMGIQSVPSLWSRPL